MSTTTNIRFKSDDNEKGSQHDIPDGGYGWIVVVCCFFSNVIVNGCFVSFGVLFASLVDDFNADRSSAAWIGSLMFAAPLFCGPISGFLVNKFRHRKAIIFGGILATIGISSSFLIDSLGLLCLTYGVIAGVGLSLPYLISVSVIKEYFFNRRSLAIGLSQSGYGVGAITFPILLDTLISEYGWKGALLLLGGIVSNIIVCGSLLRQPNFGKQINIRLIKCRTKQGNKKEYDNTALNMRDETKLQMHEDLSIEIYTLRSESGDLPNNSKSQNIKSHEVPASQMSERAPIKNNTLECVSGDLPNNSKVQMIESHDVTASNIPNNTPIENDAPNSHSGELPNKSKIQNIESSKVKSKKLKLMQGGKRLLTLFLFINALVMLWYDVPFVFTVDRAKSVGIPEREAGILMSIIGATYTLGVVLYGVLGNARFVNLKLILSVSLWLWGMTLILTPFCETFSMNAVLSGLFGLFAASLDTFNPMILIDIIGEESLNYGFGVLMFVQGITSLIGPPFAGWLFDITKDYRYTFIAAGVSIVISGTILVIVPLCDKTVYKCCKTSGHQED